MDSIISYLFLMLPLSIIFNLPILFVILKKQYLNIPYGITAAAVLGISLFTIQPFFWIVLCIFFFSSSMLSKMRVNEKYNTSMYFAKGSTKRDTMQVFANGFVPLVFALGYAIFVLLPNVIESTAALHDPTNPFFVGVFAAFAVHTADTWATEIGILSKKPPRLVTNLKQKVKPGTSGGITIDGSLASLFGSILIAAVYFITYIVTNSTIAINWQGIGIIILIIIGGFSGSIIDSLEGATIQGIYYCNHCEKETEVNPHKRCGNETKLHRGNQRINNDFVNLSSAFIATSMITLIVSLF